MDFYVQVFRKESERGYVWYDVGSFTKGRPKDPTGHVVRVTLTIDPSIFESQVDAHVGLGVDGLKAVVKELHEI